MKLLLYLALACVTASAQRIVYTKVFPKSDPAYVKITLAATGDATYQEDANEPEPAKFHLDAATTASIFGLAAKLDHFKLKLESDLKVAKSGDKSYRWESDGGPATQVTFNYTTNDDARALQDWFERLTETERMLSDLARVYRYDRLGVNEILVRIERAWTTKRLVAPEQFIALLDRIHKNESVLNMARDRAASLSEVFQRPPAP